MSEFDAKMDVLKQRFIARCADDLAQFQAYGEDASLSLEALRAIVHRMAGSAGIFGFTSIGALAAQLDDRLADAGDATMLAELVASLEPLVRARGR